MTPLKLLAASLLCAGLVSCAANNPQSQYDTSDPYGTPDYGVADTSPYQQIDSVDSIYDTPAAYEETTRSAAPTFAGPNVPAAPPRGGAGTSHTIVRGDTLWGLSRQYNVSIDAIKRANNMTNDTVVLGQRLTIPAP
jgi:LysM repeat protein